MAVQANRIITRRLKWRTSAATKPAKERNKKKRLKPKLNGWQKNKKDGSLSTRQTNDISKRCKQKATKKLPKLQRLHRRQQTMITD